MNYRKFSPKVTSFSISLIIAMSATAKTRSNSNDFKRMLTIGVSTQPLLQKSFDGLYRPDGIAAIISEPNFQSTKFNPMKNKVLDEKMVIDIAMEYLSNYSNKFGLEPESIEKLAVASIRVGSDFSVVRLEQRSNGLPVYGSSIAVTVTRKGAVSFVASNTITGIVNHFNEPNMMQIINNQQAIELARTHLRVQELKFSKVDLVVYKAIDNIHEVWRVRVIPNGGPGGDWELLIDTSTGTILRAEDKQRHFNGSGMVYKPDPLTSTHHNYADNGFADNVDNPTSANSSQKPKDSPLLTEARFPVSLKDISYIGGKYSLSGVYAACEDFDKPNDKACPSQPSPDFSFTRTNLYFDAVNAYYNIDTYMRYVNETLGVKVMPYQYKGAVRFDPHAVNGEDNSYYSEASGKVAFGQGGVDDAEDAMVVIHELGHGLHDWLTHGNAENDDSNGLGEGTGDYLAAGYVRDLPENKWKSNEPQYHWVAHWDGHNPFWPGRVTNWNIGRKYPDDVVRTGDSHIAGQYWSSCNLVARDKIGGKAMDKAFLNGLSKTIETTNQVGAAQAVIDAARDIGYSQEQIDGIAYAYNTSCSYEVKVPQPLLE